MKLAIFLFFYDYPWTFEVFFTTFKWKKKYFIVNSHSYVIKHGYYIIAAWFGSVWYFKNNSNGRETLLFSKEQMLVS